MRIVDTRGMVAVPNTVPTGNLLWVDKDRGNDSLARRGSLGIPFKTLAAAKTAAQSGDTILVLPGVYNENNLAKNGVNWHFFAGANVQFSASGSGGIFDTASVGAACSFKVTGQGVFETTNGSFTAPAIKLAYSGDNAVIECDSVSSRGIAINNSGSVTAAANIIKSNVTTAVQCGGSGTTRIRATQQAAG
jgi:hypothetical protein